MARVLVIDDNPSNLKLVAFVLGKRGYEVVTAADAEAALVAIESAMPDLILLDLQMPGVDGFTLASRLRARGDTRDVPIIAVTAYAMKGDRERALAAGCDAYMSKPIDTRGLPRLIDEPGRSAVKLDATVLLVEDNPITRKMVRFTLSKAGVAVIEADRIRAALDATAVQTPDLALIDLVLPDGDGFSLAEDLRRRPGMDRVPLLAFSGYLSKLEEARVAAVGFDDVITKPIEPSRLLRIIEGYLAPAGELHEVARGRTVLVVDDDDLQRKLAAVQLARRGFTVVEARDGQHALELARARPPDAIVSDVMMPRMDGFSLCEAVRGDAGLRQLPFILVSNSYVEKEDATLATRVGADEFLLRNPSFDGVVEKLGRLLSSEREAPVELVTRTTTASNDRVQRVIRQLERQVAIKQRVAQRCASLSAELAVLSRISESLSHDHDVDHALRAVLAACFDAGGISRGAIYLLATDGGLQVQTFGRDDDRRLATLFPDEGAVREMIAGMSGTLVAAADSDDGEASRRIREAIEEGSAIFTPLVSATEPLGGLLLAFSGATVTDDRIAFAEGVGNQISLALALARSFQQHVEAEQVAREQSALLRSVFDTMADGVIVVDAGGRITHRNEAAAPMFALEASPPLPEWPAALGLYHTDREGLYEWKDLPVARALRGEAVTDAEMLVRPPGRADGRWLIVSVRPLRDEGGAVSAAVAVFRDVTEARLAQAQAMEADRMASVGLLAAGVAHEINNPLAAVIGNVAHAHDCITRGGSVADPDEDELVETLTDARDAAERVKQIVKDLKIFSRGEEDRRDQVDLVSVLESSLRIASNEIKHRATLVKDFAEVPPVRANESRLGQVFLNLLVNAAQAIPAGRADRNRIEVSLSRDGDRVITEVSDTGEGMTAEVVERIFTPFFTTKAPGVGTGLGLAICQRIIVSMGGEIACESRPAGGTTFRVTLPACTDEARKPPPSRPAAGAVRKGRILVIDDEPIVRTLIGRLLSEHDVVLAATVAEALALIRGGERFDLILCDLMMPVLTGVDFFETLETEAPDQTEAVVFVTGGAFTAQTRAFLDRVPNRRLDKPFDLAGLRAVVHDRLG